MSGRRSRRRCAVVLVALSAMLTLVGCQVSTAVRVQVGATGGGTVTVTVRFDRAASAAVGGVSAQLRTPDLRAAGWRVTDGGGPHGSTVVTLGHGFARLSELPGLLGEVARAPGSDAPLFRLQVTQTRSAVRVDTTVTGAVDLRCGVACFGDVALARTYGSEVGVAAGAFEGRAGTALAARDLPMTLTLALPGRVTGSDSPNGPSGLRWIPVIGRRVVVSVRAAAPIGRPGARASADGGATGVGVVLAAVVVLLAVVAVLVVAGRVRRRRGRQRGGHRRAD